MFQKQEVAPYTNWQIDVFTDSHSPGVQMSESHSIARADFSDNPFVSAYLRERAESIYQKALGLSGERVVAKMHAAFQHIGRYVMGYEPVIHQTKLALATGNHQLIIGPTGVGKSYYARGVTNILSDDVQLYENQLTLETTEDSLYGMIPLRRITDGSAARNLSGSLVTADLAFIDEFFDARDELLRSTLWPLSDRRYRNGDSTIDCNIHSVIACGNYTRLNEKTAAVLGRFLFQSKLEGALSPRERIALMSSKNKAREIPDLPDEMQLSNAELRYIGYLIDGLIPGRKSIVPPEIMMLLDAVVTSFELGIKAESENQPEIFRDEALVSNRSLKQLVRVVSANALLDGREVAEVKDLSSLSLTLPVHGNRSLVEHYNSACKEVMQHANPGSMNLLRTLHAINELVERVDQGLLLRPLTIPEHLMKFFGLTNDRDISFKHIIRATESLKPTFAYAEAYRSDLLKYIHQTRKKTGLEIDHSLVKS